MSYSFLFEALEIDKDKEPDWQAAEKYVESVTEEQRHNLLCELDERCLISNSETLEDFKGEMLESLQKIKEYWTNPIYSAVVKTTMHYTTMLITGFMSYGDTTDEMDEIAWFYAVGLAKAAGFIA